MGERDLSPDTKRKVYEEEMRLILAHTTGGAIIATLFAILAAVKLYEGAHGVSLDRRLLLVWLGLKIAIVIPRVAHAFHCKRLDAGGHSPPYKWTVPMLAVDGAIWGLGAASLMSQPAPVATIVAAIMTCVASVATFGLQVRAAAAAAYVVPMLGPICAGLLIRADDVGFTGGMGLILYLALLLRTSAAWQRRMGQVFELRLAKEQAAADARQARALAETTSEHLAHALHLAEAHSQAKDRLIATVSHELRTPLHGILGLTQLTRREPNTDRVTLDYRLDLVVEATEHLSRMVTDLLDTAAIGSGKLELRLTTVDIHHQLDIVQHTFALRAQEQGLRFTVTVSPSVGRWLHGDPVRITQVLTNLLANAFKFTPLGGSVSLTVSRTDAFLTVNVTDTGPGIDAKDRERIFEPFVQASDPSGSRPDGVGLGLAISRHLARAMGGDVLCASSDTIGSTFLFTANLPELHAAPSVPPAVTTSAPHAKALAGAGRLIAIADDDPTSLLLATQVARSLGCAVEEFSNGATLLNRLVDNRPRPDIVILDWRMPILDGKSTAEAIRRHERATHTPRIPIICVSASCSPNLQALALSVGIDIAITKPCDPAALEAAIGQVLPAPQQGYTQMPVTAPYPTTSGIPNVGRSTP